MGVPESWSYDDGSECDTLALNAEDVARVQEGVAQKRTSAAYAVCIDEGGYLSRRHLSIDEEPQMWDATVRHDHAVTARAPLPPDM